MTQNSLKPELFSQVFHSPVLGLAIINQEKRIVDMNEKLADLLACKREDVLGKTTAAIGLNSKKDLHNKEDIFSLAIKEGSIEKYELEITTSQRKDLTLEFSAAILENEGDTCWLVMATDITEKKKTQEALIISEERNRNTLNRITDGFAAMDKNFCFTYMNENSGKLLNKDPKEMVGKNLFDEFPEINGHPFQKAVEKAIQEQEYVYLEDYNEPNDLWFEDHIYPSPEGVSIYFRNITNRKKNDDALINSEMLFRRLISNAPVAIFQTDTQGNYTFVNEEWLQYSSLSFTEALGTGWTKAIHPDDLDRVFKEWMKSISNGSEFKTEFRFLDKKGKTIWLAAKAVTLIDTNNKIYGHIGVATDISERKIAETTLMESEEKYRTLVEQASDGIFIANKEFEFVEANSMFCKMLGYSKNEVLNLKIQDISVVEPNDIAYRFNEIKQGTALIQERRIKRKDGSMVHVEISSSLNKFGNFLSIIRDVSERKQTEKDLAESENRLRTILESEPECVKLLNKKSQIVEMNPAGLAMIEADNLEMVKGKEVMHIIKPAYQKAFIALVNNIFKGNSGKLQFEITGLKGTPLWLETNAVPLKNAEGEITALLGVTRDITQRKKAEQKINQLNQDLEQRVIERTQELEKTNKELEEINDLFVGREARIIELKEELAALKKQAGIH